MLENKKNIIIAGIIVFVISFISFFMLYNYFEMKRELQYLKEEQASNIVSLEDEVGDEIIEDEENLDDNTDDELKQTILQNIQDESKKDIEEVLKLEPISGKTVSTLEEASDKASNMIFNASITFLFALEAVSGYMALVFIIVGIIGAVFSQKAPLVQKGFIGMIISGPILFILINYGPALLNFLSLGNL